MAERQESFSLDSLPVLQLPGHPLGDAAAQQPHQEEGEHAQRHHQQDVVLGRRRHHLHGQVREAVGRRHLQVGGMEGGTGEQQEADRGATGSCQVPRLDDQVLLLSYCPVTVGSTDCLLLLPVLVQIPVSGTSSSVNMHLLPSG